MKPPAQRVLRESTSPVKSWRLCWKEARASAGRRRLSEVESRDPHSELCDRVTGELSEATLEKLRQLLCHSSTEKTEKVLKQAGIETGEKKHKAPARRTPRRVRPPGHGRNGAAAYRGARKVEVPHASLKAGDPCPDAHAAAKSIRSAILACWCGSKGRRRSPRRCMSWRSCGATCAGTCLRPQRRKERARRSTTRRRRA